MQEWDDIALLREYVEHDTEKAFAELVARHVNKVYSVALRHTRNPHQAEEITQTVFVILARKCRRLGKGVILSGWLYQTARLTAVTFLRSEIRRARREQEAHMQSSSNENEPGIWLQIEPLLDTALAGLSETDRDAVVLRFLDGKSMKEVGAALGASEDAAKMRVHRAVEKLRQYFTRRGVVIPASMLTSSLAANAVHSAPMGLAAAATATALSSSSVTTAAIAAATKTIAMTTTQKALVITTVAVLAGTGVYEARQASQLRDRVHTLQLQQTMMAGQIDQMRNERDDAIERLASLSARPAPRLPAPRIQAALPAADNLQSTNLYERFKDGLPVLPREKVEAYLNENGRDAASLLAAYRTTGDSSLLEEAKQKHPNDPQVAFEAAMQKEASPDVRHQWLSVFKESAPDNALANYLLALDGFKSGDMDRAVEELMAASGKPLQDYTSERFQSDAEAYLAAGFSVADAKTASSTQLLLPQLQRVKELGLDMIQLASSYRQAGDAASAQAALQLTVDLGQHYSTPSPGEPLVSQLVGIAIESLALQGMDANHPYGNDGQTVQDRLNELAQQQSAARGRNQQAEAAFPRMTEQDWINYRDRWMMFGEQNAIQWVVNKYGRE